MGSNCSIPNTVQIVPRFAVPQSGTFTSLVSLYSIRLKMSSISENRNPSSETSMNMTTQSSISDPPEHSVVTEFPIPNWLELPEDIWFIILSKLQTIFIIENAQKVCMLFRKLCKQPAMFKTIKMFLPDFFMFLPYDVNKMTRFAVDRSAGGLVDISLQNLCDDETLLHIVDSSKNLKRLVLQQYVDFLEETLIKAVGKFPMLEELQMISCRFSDDTVEAVGRACPSLKSFSLNDIDSKIYLYYFGKDYANEDCKAIARTMPQLRHLQLIGSEMTNEGLGAIFDGCPLLESLDLRACFQIDLSGDFGKRCKAIKHVRYPDESTKDCVWQACAIQVKEGEGEGEEEEEEEEEYDLSGSDQEFEYTYEDYLDDNYDDFFREDDDYRLYRDYFRGSLGYDSSD